LAAKAPVARRSHLLPEPDTPLPVPRLCSGQVIADSIKAYVAFEKKLVDALPKEERATARPIDIRCGAGGCAGALQLGPVLPPGLCAGGLVLRCLRHTADLLGMCRHKGCTHRPAVLTCHPHARPPPAAAA